VELSSRRLLRAAAALIVEKGWEATTAAEIGRRAGYSRAMVHARYGSKEAILEAFLHEYVKRLNPDPDPGTSGIRQVLAHFDRIQEIHSEDREVLRAMFVATFEAAKTTSPLRERVQAQLLSGAVKVEAGLRNGIEDGSIRSDIDIDSAVKDITAAVFGIAFQWVAVPHAHDLDHELNCVRSRIIQQYGSPPPARRHSGSAR
jgi:AcrR family transcriptional regulator